MVSSKWELSTASAKELCTRAMVHDGNCLGLLPIILDVWLFVTMKVISFCSRRRTVIMNVNFTFLDLFVGNGYAISIVEL